MNAILHNLQVSMTLTESGDALFWGFLDDRDVPGEKLRNLMFAWHESSYYGTVLDLQQAGDISVVVLPADMVLPYFTEPDFMEILHFEDGNEGMKAMRELAPLLYQEAQAGRYVPSLHDFRKGTLGWTWDAESDALKSFNWAAAQSLDALGQGLAGLRAAFSAVVTAEHYASEAAISDLRRDYPALFQRSASPVTLTEEEWLASLGWRPDTAPFRPALQLLEPDEEDDTWRLRLVLQDKQDRSVLAPIRLAADGTAAGTWDSSWSPYVLERSPGWAASLAESLPSGSSGLALLSRPLSDESAWTFLTTDSRHLLDGGWNVMLPGWWEAASKRKPRLRAKVSSEAGGKRQSLFGLNALVNFDWRIAIGEADLSEAEFAALLSRNERLIRFRGQWVYLDPALLEQIRRLMASVDPQEGLSLLDIFQLHLLNEAEKENAPKGGSSPEDDAENEERIKLEVELNAHLMGLLRQLAQPSELQEIPIPTGLRAELRSYQHEGFTWLTYLRKFGLGACLADDMGLGKTIQFITYLLHHQAESEQPALLICPTSVLGNWQKELVRFAPDLKVLLYYGKGRLSGEALAEALKDTDIVLTSYTTALMEQETLQETVWSSLCLDEAQNIKNAQNKQSAAVRSLQAKHRIALTGTPIENRLSELWSIYDFLNPGYLGNQRGFQHRFSNPIEKHQDEERTMQLQKLVKPFMLRRKKKDPAIQLDLPDKQEMKVYLNLTAEQGALYEQAVKNLMERMQKLEGMERKGAILSALTQLKQLCDHPVLLTKEAPISEESLLNEDSREGFVLRSAKLERLVAMVGELRDEGDSCLIFTQYVSMGKLLADILQAQRNEPVLYLNGSTPKQERDKMIDKFQGADGPGIFILSLKAGGVGLNLTAANHVFHFDRWWNPAVENQATDRAYRMGQKRNVQVHKFISLGTLEEKIDEMLESKMSLSENVISTSEAWITELSNEELHDLFALRKDW
ncbi:DEAD/DEAH box helicase [Paenibacillus sp. CGMCC 1.16610]|uniref:ATP-dependent helicase n=1 Tax=Paenibacillus anseongense TaxID=2682845 RepID=A0ABW9UEL8_9BACL|nr:MULTISPECIES: DEAD/DEAH box helicase [Paenibacillus]MBA2938387.1 DEAD/DEAH box helicase [Paenibacillus sp. CGMCC 1.16610]MVQ37446.1 ATP-dependent helicase [Paenibacillus anseongense]